MSSDNKFLLGLGIVLALALALIARASSSETVYNDLAQAVFKLTPDNKMTGGTGFLAQAKSKKAVTVTNWHVCQSSKTEFMYAERLLEFSDVKLKKLEVDPEHDLCILEPAPGKALEAGSRPTRFAPLFVEGYPYLRVLAPATGLYVGEIEDVLLFPLPSEGCPKGFQPYATLFSFMCMGKFVMGDTTIPIFPGNSGSPIVDKNSKLVGVANSTNQQTGYGSFIPIRHLKQLLDKY